MPNPQTHVLAVAAVQDVPKPMLRVGNVIVLMAGRMDDDLGSVCISVCRLHRVGGLLEMEKFLGAVRCGAVRCVC